MINSRMIGLAHSIITMVAKLNNIDRSELTGKKRDRNTTRARHIAQWLIRKDTNLTLCQIAEIFNRDHASVMYGINKIQSEIDQDGETKFLFLDEEIEKEKL